MKPKILDRDARYASQPITEPRHTESFKKLQVEWYLKLKIAGFNDIEDSRLDDRPLKAWHNHRFKAKPIVSRDAAQRYFERAEEILITYRFKKEMHRVVWEMHCRGLSKRKIANLLNNQPKYKRESVGLIINRIAKDIKGSK